MIGYLVVKNRNDVIFVIRIIFSKKYWDYQWKWFMNNSWEWLRKGQPNNTGSLIERIKTCSTRMPLARSFEPGRYSISCHRSDAKLNIMILYFSEIHLSADKSPCKIYLSAYKKSQVGHRNSTPLLWTKQILPVKKKPLFTGPSFL